MQYSPNSKALRELKAKLSRLSEEQLEVVVGLLLGDVSIQSQNKGLTHRLKFEWGNAQKEYAFHVFSLFKGWILTEPKERIRVNSKGTEVSTWWFQTFSHEAFNHLAKLFLDSKGKKIVTEGLISNHLTPRGLAYWFFDDGGKLDYSSNQGKGIVFNTQSFTEDEVERMCVELREKFGLICWTKLNKGKPVIAISGTSYERFIGLIGPFVIPSMVGKLPSPRKASLPFPIKLKT